MKAQLYTLRPNRTSLWLPVSVADEIGVSRGDTLTEAQFQHEAVAGLIAGRIKKETTTATGRVKK